MATAKKHMERSHRSYRNNAGFSDFERKASAKKIRNEQKNLLARIFGGK